MGIKKQYVIYCDNDMCGMPEGIGRSQFIEGYPKRKFKKIVRACGWIIKGKKTYCCPGCQKEAEGNADKK
jgi:hypothetical protein